MVRFQKMAGLFGRIVAQFMNEVLVKALANSKTFQRFALRTDGFIQAQKSAVNVVKEDALKKGGEALKSSASNKKLEIGGIDFGKFFHEFKEEIAASAAKGPGGPGGPKPSTGTKK